MNAKQTRDKQPVSQSKSCAFDHLRATRAFLGLPELFFRRKANEMLDLSLHLYSVAPS